MNEIIKIIIPIFIGGFLQYFFSKSFEWQKQCKMLKTQAYVDYLQSVAGKTMAHKFNIQDKVNENTTLLLDAKLRISIYGSKKVVESLAAFSRTGEILDTPESQKSFVTLLKLMRTENTEEKHMVSNDDLAQIFF